MARYQLLEPAERRELCGRVDLPRLIARDNYPVFEKGRSIKTMFRPEKTPSVSLTFKDGCWWWYDFGVGKGGDALCYLHEIRKLPFPEALAELRSLAGVPLPDYTPSTPTPSRKASTKPQEPLRLREGTDRELEALAALRGVSVEAVTTLQSLRRLSFGRYCGHSAFFIGGGDYWQAKRLDGELWFGSGKCITASGNPPNFIAANFNPDTTTHVILVEGLVGILEGVEAVLRCCDSLGTVAVVGSYNKCSRLTGEQARKLSQRRVLIVSDNDEGGLEASTAWFNAITGYGGEAVREAPSSGKDLGDILKAEVGAPGFVSQFLRSSPPQEHTFNHSIHFTHSITHTHP